jgi:hypothetical protein
LKTDYWFDADLLENLEDGQGTVIRLHGIDKKWTKVQNAEWIEEGDDSQKKKWWEFWK